MQHRRDARLGRFGKKSKDLLVDYINEHNNRLLAPDQLDFGTPSTMDDTGLTEIAVSFAPEMGWSDEKEIMAYYRVEPSLFLRGQPISIYVTGYSDVEICNAIFEQYGLFIEPEFITLELVTQSLPDITPVTDLPGFEPEDAEPEPPVEMPTPGYLDNRNYKLTFKQTHLIFFGEVQVQTRRAMQSLGNPIDSLIDLRQFYTDGNMGVPPVDLLIPKGELYVTREYYPALEQIRSDESYLYGLKAGQVISLAPPITRILSNLTGDDWISSPDANDFNLYGSTVIYNGFVSKDQTLEESGYNWVVAIELDARCTNLTGIVKIGYRYASDKVPGNNPFNQSSVPPLFNH